MNDRMEELKRYLVPGRRVHLIGIGGVSMRPLGCVLRGMGMEVSGSDRDTRIPIDELTDMGIRVMFGHLPENVQGAECVIRTAAVHDDNPEIMAARAAGIPVFERAQAWGVLMFSYKNAICIAGTHGKTTTTAMLTHILMEADTDPTVMVGGYLPLLDSGYRVGKSDTMVIESCEFCDSFLNFFPTMAVVLNVEADHLDYFKDLAGVQRSFRAFAALSSDKILANGDDEHVRQTLEGMEYLSFGVQAHNRFRAENISADWRSFDVTDEGQFYCHVDLAVIGRHNMLNALAAAAIARLMEIPGEATAAALGGFTGAHRRMQFRGKVGPADLYDDFAHHPDEIRATLEAVRSLNYKRVVVAFQPHTYTRTKLLFDDFVRELSVVDHLVISEIYAAREVNTIGISARELAEKLPGSVYRETLPEVAEYLKSIAQEGDIMLTMGCGDVWRAADMLVGPAR